MVQTTSPIGLSEGGISREDRGQTGPQFYLGELTRVSAHVNSQRGLYCSALTPVVSDSLYPEFHALWHTDPEFRLGGCTPGPGLRSQVSRGVNQFILKRTKDIHTNTTLRHF